MDIEYKFFSEINLRDPFFDSLREDYPEFDKWYQKKSLQKESAYVAYQGGRLVDFLYLKEENGGLGKEDSIIPEMPLKKRLKVGTFKIDARHTTRGERFIKKILDIALLGEYEEVYVTIFPKHESLIKLFRQYGFEERALKKHLEGIDELVLIRDMKSQKNDIYLDYPKIALHPSNKYLLAIYPKYHTKIFPDSILKNETIRKEDLIKDISPTNSIHKIYLCFMKDVSVLKRGDLLAIYRTSDIPGKAYYRSVVTSICTVEEIKEKKDFPDIESYVKYTNRYSIFDESELRTWFKKPNIVVIKMLYNVALEKKLTRQVLIEELGFDSNVYWGFFELSEKQFAGILKRGEADENFIID